MKKIFAFILASLMVLSLVPASAFAAITKEDPCTNENGEHTLATCPSYTKIDTVAPTCAKGGKPGYTIYECDKCGEKFLGDFVKAPKHVWVTTADGNKHKDTAANCGNGTPAIKWEKCSVCGEAAPGKCDAAHASNCDHKCGLGFNEYEAEHSLVVKVANGCATIYTCTVCNKDYYLDADGNATTEIEKIGHDWKFVDATVRPYYDENGKPHNGTAVYKCKDCKETKEVEIICEHVCVFERISGYKAPTCTAVGKYAEYQCAKCLEIVYYKETFNDKGNLTGKQDLTAEELEALKERGVNVIPTVPHTLQTETLVPGKCEKTGYCTTCKQQANNVVDHVNLVQQAVLAPTCTTIGYSAVACNWCQYSDIVLVPAINHTVAGESVTIEVPVATANCATKGKVLVLCPLPDCNSTVQFNNSSKYVYGDKVYTIAAIKEGSYDKTKHDIVEQVLNEGNCTANRIVISYCANGCPEYQYGVRVEAAKGHVEYTTESYTCSTVGYFKNVTKVCKECQNVVSTQATPVSFVSTFTTLDEAKLFHGLVTKKTAPGAVDENGNVEYTTTYEANTVDHKFEKVEEKSFASTCTRIGYTTYKCTGCNTQFIVIDPVKKHEAKESTPNGYKAPTCSKEGNTGYYTCKDCGVYFAVVDGKQVILTSANGIVTKKHTQKALVKFDIKDCTDKVIGKYYKCADCNTYFEDAKAEKKLSKKPSDISHKYETLLAGVTTTCDTDGIAKVQWCTVCNVLVAAVTVDKKDTDLNTNATAKNDIIKAEDQIYVKKENVTFFDKDGVKYISYIENGDEEATIVALTTPKLNHEGFVDEIESHLEHNDDCSYTDPLYIYEECTLCGDEWLRSFIDAHRHVNAKGELLATDCNGEGISDNVCVICGLEIEVINHNVNNENNTLETVEVKATCIAEGYVYVYCTLCDYRDVDGKLAIDKNNHAAPAGQELNYAQNGYKTGKVPCTACGYKGEKAELGKNENGMEILLSATVNGQSDILSATYGSIIEITVSLGSLKGVELWGLDFPISYNSNVLEFLSAETTWNQDSAFANRLASDYKVYNPREQKDIPVGIVKVIAHADDAGVAVKGTQELVKLYFKVKYNADAAWDYANNFTFATANTVLGNDYFTEFATTAVTENDKAINTFYKNREEKIIVKFAPMMDVVVDNKEETIVNISDILAIYSLMLFGEYDVAADINADGQISPEDLRLAYAFITGATTLEAHFNPKKEDSQIQPRA